MAEGELEPWLVETQNTIGKLISKPKMTEKYLKKPPFRFLHDIVMEVCKATKFADGLFGPEETDAAALSDKQQKLDFLNKAISVVSFALNEKIDVQATKVVAGLEAEKTNGFLQKLHQAATKAVDKSAEAVARVKGGESVAEKKKPKKPKEEGEGEKKEEKKEKKEEKKEEPPAAEAKAEGGDAATAEEEKKKKDEERKKRKKREEEKKKKEEAAAAAAAAAAEAPAEAAAAAEAPAPAPEEDEKRKKEEEKKKKEESRARKREEERLRKEQEAEAARQQAEAEAAQAAQADGQAQAEAEAAQAAAQSQGDDPDVARNMAEQGYADDAPSAQPGMDPGDFDARPERPRTAGRKPPKVRSKVKEVQDDPALNQNVAAPSLIVDGAKDDDDEDMFEEAATTQGGGSAINTVGDDGAGHGKLVQDLLKEKKAEEEKERVRKEEEATREAVEEDGNKGIRMGKLKRKKDGGTQHIAEVDTDKLSETIQQLCQAANPLGKSIDLVHQDIANMGKELDHWRQECREASDQYQNELKMTDEVLQPLYQFVAELDDKIAEQKNKIRNTRSRIWKNNIKTQTLLGSVVNPGGP